MLANEMVPGTKLVGLAELVNSGRPAFAGAYRVVIIGTVRAVEFFDKQKRGGTESIALKDVQVLPYQTGQIAKSVVGSGQEIISGPFTGCVMSVFRQNQSVWAGHVDTNPDTTQRGSYDQLKSGGGVKLISEYDSAGKIPVELKSMHVIFCIADTGGIRSFLVKMESSGVSVLQKANPMFGQKTDMWVVGAQTVYTVVRGI